MQTPTPTLYTIFIRHVERINNLITNLLYDKRHEMCYDVGYDKNYHSKAMQSGTTSNQDNTFESIIDRFESHMGSCAKILTT